MFDVIQQFPVSLPPAVDALLDITHNQIVRVGLCHAVVKQLPEVLPLNRTCVLKLVNHDVFQIGSHLLEDERRIGVSHQCAEQ